MFDSRYGQGLGRSGAGAARRPLQNLILRSSYRGTPSTGPTATSFMEGAIVMLAAAGDEASQ